MPSPESEIEVSSPLDTQTGLPTAAKGDERAIDGPADTPPDDQSTSARESDAGDGAERIPSHTSPSTKKPLTRQTLSLMWSTAAEFPWRVGLSLVVPIVTVFSARFVGPYVISLLLTQIQNDTVSWQSGWPLVVAYGISQLIGHVIGWRIALYTTWSFEVKAMRRLWQRVFDHLTAQSIGFHSDRFSGSLVSQTNKLTSAFEMFWDTVVWQVVPVATTVVAAVTITAFILPWYAVFLLGMTLFFAGFVVFSARTMERLNVDEAQSSTRMTGFLADVLTNISAVKAAGAEKAERATARDISVAWAGSNLRVMRAFLGYSTGFSSVVAIINTVAVLAAVVASEQHYLSVAAVYLATTYTLTVTDQLWEITQVMRHYNRVMGDAHDMVEILAIPPAVADRPMPSQCTGTASAAVSEPDTTTPHCPWGLRLGSPSLGRRAAVSHRPSCQVPACRPGSSARTETR